MDRQTNDSQQNPFNHEYTPPELANINLELSKSLAQTPLDEAHLQNIVAQRANLVETLLSNLDEQQKRHFAALELKTNDAILALVNEQKNHAKNALSKVSKSSKAIKKYHQV